VGVVAELDGVAGRFAAPHVRCSCVPRSQNAQRVDCGALLESHPAPLSRGELARLLADPIAATDAVDALAREGVVNLAGDMVFAVTRLRAAARRAGADSAALGAAVVANPDTGRGPRNACTFDAKAALWGAFPRVRDERARRGSPSAAVSTTRSGSRRAGTPFDRSGSPMRSTSKSLPARTSMTLASSPWTGGHASSSTLTTTTRADPLLRRS
jgi:hypothetical protein